MIDQFTFGHGNVQRLEMSIDHGHLSCHSSRMIISLDLVTCTILVIEKIY